MNITTKVTIALLLLLWQSSFMCSAQQDTTVIAEKMALVKNLHGKWSGSGWYHVPDQGRFEFNQTEHVYPRLGGRILAIEGEGRDPESNEIVFQAFAVLHYSQEEGGYRFNSWTNKDSKRNLASAKINGNEFVWWFDTDKGGTIKYTIIFTENTWVEDGHYSPDGEKWYPFFHMDLKKLQ